MLALPLALFAVFAQDPAVEDLRKEVERLKAELRARDAARMLLVQPPVVVPALPSPAVPPATPQALTPEWQREIDRLKARSIVIPSVNPLVPPGASPPRAGETRGSTVVGKVIAVAPEIGLVVLSIGKDDGVKEGDAYVVDRAGTFVAKVVVDRTDRKWSAAKVVMKNTDPRVPDDVVRLAPAAAVPDPVSPRAADSLREIRKELDDIRRQIRDLSDHLVPAWGDVGVSVEEASPDLKAHLGVDRGLLVRRVRAGSAAEKAGLRVHDVVPRLSEAQLVQVLEKGGAVEILRQGTLQRSR
jgi:hypothetical protein